MGLDFKSNRIAELRKEVNLSQSALAVHVGTSQANLSRWEKGIIEPSIVECWRLADFFNVSIDFLCGRREE